MKNIEIAKMLNISKAAVSLALNDKPGVSESTRKSVKDLKFSSEVNYNTNLKKGSILFSIHKKDGDIISETPFFMLLTETIQQLADKEGYSLSISHYNPSIDIKQYIENININDVLGILLLATEMDSNDLKYYDSLNKPIVLIDSWFQGKSIDTVLMDNMDGIVQAMHYAYECGHRKIGFLKSKVYANNFNERFLAYVTCLDNLNISYNEKYVYDLHCTTTGAYSDMLQIIQNKYELPTILISSNDIMAVGVMNALKASGYFIPKDISVIGFDNMPISMHLEPPLTSVSIDHEQIGEQAVRRLIQKIECIDKCSYNLRINVGVKLIKRESVKIINAQ